MLMSILYYQFPMAYRQLSYHTTQVVVMDSLQCCVGAVKLMLQVLKFYCYPCAYIY